MPNKIKILYIDDEITNLVGFKASFRFDYHIFTADNATRALNILIENPDIQIIFCDQRMPDKTGVEFFEEIRSLFPLPIRILLTAYADIDSVIDAINKGNIYRYVKKPWTQAGILSTIDEASKFYASNSLLSVKNEELQRAYSELDKFAFSVSHDIRGPMGSILTAINYAKGLDDINELKDILAMMEKSVLKLDDFIISMHEYYNLQRGELLVKEIDFHKFIENVRDIYNIYASANNVQFDIEVNQSEFFYNDEISLTIILNNLLSNAFKYQKKDSNNKLVKLLVEVRNGMALIQVTDNGVGIAQKHISDIFNLSFRSNSTQENGFGFGLYNLRGALMKLNGQIDVNSTLGIGTTFKITIPNISV
jgi:signal transduction histidine kinase